MCNSTGATRTKAISEQFIFFSGQQRWRPQTCNKPQVPKVLYSLSALQNGRNVKGEQLHLSLKKIIMFDYTF